MPSPGRFSFRVTLTTILCWMTLAQAQQFTEALSSEALRPFVPVNGFGAATFSVLNNTGVQRDISSLSFNPAFLINNRSPKAFLGGYYIDLVQNAKLESNSRAGQQSLQDYSFTQFGFAYPLDVYRGQLVFAFTHTPSAYFLNQMESRGAVATDYGDVYQQLEIEESGQLNTTRILAAVEFLKNLNFGLSLNIHNGNRKYLFTGTEIDTNNIYLNHETVYRENIRPTYQGMNFDLGLTYQSETYKFGLRITTPLNLKVHEISQFDEYFIYDDGSDSTRLEDYDFEYRSRYPFEIASNFAVMVRNITFCVDFITHYWDKLAVDDLEDKQAINRDLQWNLRNTTDIGVGVTIPLHRRLSVRLGYRHIPTLMEDAETDQTTHLLGAGVEGILGQKFIYGIGYQIARGEQILTHPYFGSVSRQDFTWSQLTISVALLL